jgi:alternate signal-mediated exported protein
LEESGTNTADVKWYLENPQTNGGSRVEITNLTEFLISPGDRLSYTDAAKTYSAYVEGSDIKAELALAKTGAGAVFASADVKNWVHVTFALGNEASGHVVTLAGNMSDSSAYLGSSKNDKVSVKVFIEFDPMTPANVLYDVNKAIDFEAGLDLALEQVLT